MISYKNTMLCLAMILCTASLCAMKKTEQLKKDVPLKDQLVNAILDRDFDKVKEIEKITKTFNYLDSSEKRWPGNALSNVCILYTRISHLPIRLKPLMAAIFVYSFETVAYLVEKLGADPSYWLAHNLCCYLKNRTARQRQSAIKLHEKGKTDEVAKLHKKMYIVDVKNQEKSQPKEMNINDMYKELTKRLEAIKKIEDYLKLKTKEKIEMEEL